MDLEFFAEQELFLERYPELLSYEEWVDAMLLLKCIPIAEHLDALEARDVTPALFECSTRHWVGVISDEIARGDFTRTRAFGARFAVAAADEVPETTGALDADDEPKDPLPFVFATEDTSPATTRFQPAAPAARAGDTVDVSGAVDALQREGDLPFRRA